MAQIMLSKVNLKPTGVHLHKMNDGRGFYRAMICMTDLFRIYEDSAGLAETARIHTFARI